MKAPVTELGKQVLEVCLVLLAVVSTLGMAG